MVESPNASGPKKIFALTLAFLIATDIVVLLNIPILRQVMGVIFLTIIPGLLLLFLLKLNKLRLSEKIVLTVGLSIAFLMFWGLIFDQVLFGLGYATPLSTEPLVIFFSITLFILAIIAYKTNKEAFSFNLSNFKLSTAEKAFLLLPIFFPFLSIMGIHLMNTADNNIVLIALLFLIPGYVILIGIFNRQVPVKIYPVVIFMCGISLLLMWVLRSNYIIMGSDTDQEYYFFLVIADAQHWQMFEPSTVNTCLSVTLLPIIYQCFLSINPEDLFRFLYPLLFSIFPIVIYIISKKYIGGFYAFIASCLLISFYGFFMTHCRTNTAILFFALSLMVLFHDEISALNKRLLFIIFATVTIVSHYSTAFIFFFLILLTWIVLQILPKFTSREGKPVIPPGTPIARCNLLDSSQEEIALRSNANTSHVTTLKPHKVLFKRTISITIVILFFTLIFFWFGQAAGVAFGRGVAFISQTFVELHNFFLLESRGTIVEIATGQNVPYGGVPGKIEFISSWLIILFIAMGVLVATINFIKGSGYTYSPIANLDCTKFLPEKLDAEYLAFVIAAFLILTLSVTLPHISSGYSLHRIYFQMMVLLSTFFVFGGIIIAKHIKLQPVCLLLIILIPYFMCTTGTMYQIFDIPKTLVLNSEGRAYDTLIIQEQESYAAKWLKEDSEWKGCGICTDTAGRSRVVIQGPIAALPYSYVNNNRLLEPDKKISGYIYLRYYNVVEGKLRRGYEEYNITEYQDKFVGKGKIYNNGGAEIWK
jgi:uncharacterized membrane protein